MSTPPTRLVLDSNNLFLLALSGGSLLVVEPETKELNTQNVPTDVFSWKRAGVVGTGDSCTHSEMEVFGAVFDGAKVAALSGEIISLQALVNREGFTVMYFNVGGRDMYLRPTSLMRRHNDLFDWSKHGVAVPTPVGTEWDRFQIAADGKKLVPALSPALLTEGVEGIEAAYEELEREVGILKSTLEAY